MTNPSHKVSLQLAIIVVPGKSINCSEKSTLTLVTLQESVLMLNRVLAVILSSPSMKKAVMFSSRSSSMFMLLLTVTKLPLNCSTESLPLVRTASVTDRVVSVGSSYKKASALTS